MIIGPSLTAQNIQGPGYEELFFDSKILTQSVPVQIFLPSDYAINRDYYQVHYVFDGRLVAKMY